MRRIKLDVFGRDMVAEQAGGRWRLYLRGAEGKRRPVEDIVIPAGIADVPALLTFLDDHFHEYATPQRPAIRVIE